jgi:DNA-binding SARP family transcriptional activator
MTLQIHLLGPVQLNRDGVPIELPYQRPLALLVYLLLTHRPHSRQRLTDLLFDGPADPRAALRWNLSKLRSALDANHLVSNRREITFNLESDYWVDVECFEALAAGAEVDSLRQAVELYRGDFLEGVDVRNAPRFEHWALAQRARLHGLALDALHRLAVTYSEQGEAGRSTALGYTNRLLALEPWREEAHRGLMLLLARGGQRRAALAQYETCRRVLAEELGVEPGPETVDLYQRIRAGDLALLHPPHLLA